MTSTVLPSASVRSAVVSTGGPDRRSGPRAGGTHAPWLLVLPVLVFALVAPPALGADAVARAPQPATLSAVGPVVPFGPLPPGEAPELSLAEFAIRAHPRDGVMLDRRMFTLTGFTPAPTGMRLARMTSFCCVADARPTIVRLVADPALLAGLAPTLDCACEAPRPRQFHRGPPLRPRPGGEHDRAGPGVGQPYEL